MKALILAGGAGTRFWPLSRGHRPKQLLALDGHRSLLAATVDRLSGLVEPQNLWICTTVALREAVIAQVPTVPARQVLAEPEGRNTAPAIGWSLVSMPAHERDEVVAVFPADHRVGDPAAFRAAIETAARVAGRDRRIMTLGVVPRWAETGFGYLELGEELDPGNRVSRVVRFIEKPDRETAEAFVASGRYYWNPGIFVFPGTTMLEALERFVPEIHSGLAQIEAAPGRLAEIYPRLPAVSIDIGIMEKLDDLATLPLDCGWSDLGSWLTLDEVLDKDADGNALVGDVVALDSRDNLLLADQGCVAAVGVEDLVVVRTADVVLVAPKRRSQEVRDLVDRLRIAGRDELL
jgi:mannose-1-phosphate guanylyltransferase